MAIRAPGCLHISKLVNFTMISFHISFCKFFVALTALQGNLRHEFVLMDFGNGMCRMAGTTSRIFNLIVAVLVGMVTGNVIIVYPFVTIPAG